MTMQAERPLVTFALFAYNQEAFIREAVEGAFSQTYEPLEIILSDDCSSDRTFAIMQEMAAGYGGPHRVRVRRSEGNLGVLAHVLSVAREARGVYVVVGAGDDVSFEKRTEVSTQYFQQDDVLAVSGDDIIIDDRGNAVPWDEGRIKRRDGWHEKSGTWIHGATAAYRASFLKPLPIPERRVFYEDMVFSDILSVLGKRSIRVRDTLIKYRYHSGNLSNRIEQTNRTEETERALIERWGRAAEAKSYCLRWYEGQEQASVRVHSPAIRKIKAEMGYLDILSRWQNHSFLQKCEFLYRAVLSRQIGACVQRLFGVSVFNALARFRSH